MDENDSLNINGVNKFKIIQKNISWPQTPVWRGYMSHTNLHTVQIFLQPEFPLKSLPPARVLQGQPAGNSSPGLLCKSSSHFQAYCSGYDISFHPTEGAQIYLTDNCPIYQNISTEDSTNLPPVFLSANRSTAPFFPQGQPLIFCKAGLSDYLCLCYRQ